MSFCQYLCLAFWGATSLVHAMPFIELPEIFILSGYYFKLLYVDMNYQNHPGISCTFNCNNHDWGDNDSYYLEDLFKSHDEYACDNIKSGFRRVSTLSKK